MYGTAKVYGKQVDFLMSKFLLTALTNNFWRKIALSLLFYVEGKQFLSWIHLKVVRLFLIEKLDFRSSSFGQVLGISVSQTTRYMKYDFYEKSYQSFTLVNILMVPFCHKRRHQILRDAMFSSFH